MGLKGFRIKILDKEIIKENNLNPDARYKVSGMDNDDYHVELENGVQIEVPIEASKMVSEQKVING